MTTITIKSTEINIIPVYSYNNYNHTKPTFNLEGSICYADAFVCKTCPAKNLSPCVVYFTSEFHTLPITHPEIFL